MVQSLLFPSLIALLLHDTFCAHTQYNHHVTTPIDGEFILDPSDKIYHSDSDYVSRDCVLSFQLDSNFVLYDKIVDQTSKDRVLWASNTTGMNGAYVYIKYTGNIEIQTITSQIIWESDTSGHSDTQPHQLSVEYRCAYLTNKDRTVLWFIGDACDASLSTTASTTVASIPLTTILPTMTTKRYTTKDATNNPTKPANFSSVTKSITTYPSVSTYTNMPATLNPTIDPTAITNPTNNPSTAPVDVPTLVLNIHTPTKYPTNNPIIVVSTINEDTEYGKSDNNNTKILSQYVAVIVGNVLFCCCLLCLCIGIKKLKKKKEMKRSTASSVTTNRADMIQMEHCYNVSYLTVSEWVAPITTKVKGNNDEEIPDLTANDGNNDKRDRGLTKLVGIMTGSKSIQSVKGSILPDESDDDDL